MIASKSGTWPKSVGFSKQNGNIFIAEKEELACNGCWSIKEMDCAKDLDWIGFAHNLWLVLSVAASLFQHVLDRRDGIRSAVVRRCDFFFPHALLRFVEKATIKGMLCYECVSVLITTNTQPQLFWDWIQWQIHFESTKGATAPKVFKLMLHL